MPQYELDRLERSRIRNAGNVGTLRFQSDDALPKSNADAATLAAFHQQHASRGTFDPVAFLHTGRQ
jgi:hypothetical protein